MTEHTRIGQFEAHSSSQQSTKNYYLASNIADCYQNIEASIKEDQSLKRHRLQNAQEA